MTASLRRDFAVPPAVGTYAGIDLALLDPSSEEDRRILIEAEHPELHKALHSDVDEVHVGGATINPRLHIAMHEVVANQLWDDDPTEVWTTARRLSAAGYDRHEILHMLASVASDVIYNALHHNTPVLPDQIHAALADLPTSWERQRTATTDDHHANRAERRAARNRRH